MTATDVENKTGGRRGSRVGKRPVKLPAGVTVTVVKDGLAVKGPKGSLEKKVGEGVSIEVDKGEVRVLAALEGRDGARLQGLARALIQGMVDGVTNGFTRTLELVGTGYRAEMKGQTLTMSVGLSHQIVYPVPAGIKVEIPPESKGTRIVMTGCDKAVMGQTAATLRSYRPPSPYGGKGVRYFGERVREKAGKAGKSGK